MKSVLLILTCLLMNATWSQETTTLYLIRHAEKADATTDPDLSEAGKERAQKWAKYFQDKGIAYFYTTPYKRTLQTILPSVNGTPSASVTKYDPRVLSLREVVERHGGSSVLIVGHSNTIPAYINSLIGENKYPDIPETEYGHLYIITIQGEKITHQFIEM